MKEIRKGNKAIRIMKTGVFYGQYYDNEFQVLKAKFYSNEANAIKFAQKLSNEVL